MKHQRLLDPQSPPDHNPEYVDPDTGYKVKAGNLRELYANARLHREANGLPIPDQFEWMIETQICQKHPGRCVNRDGSPPDMSCSQRGAEVRREGCATCGGVQAKIMACLIHGECTEFKHPVGVKACWACRERIPLTAKVE